MLHQYQYMPHPLFLFSIIRLFHQYEWILLPVFIGLVAGLIAQMFVPGRGFGLGATFVLGIVGAWLGKKYLFTYFTFIEKPLIRQIAAATVCAMALAFVINIFRPGKDRDKTKWRHN